MGLPEHIDYDDLREFGDALFGPGPVRWKLLPPKNDKIPVGGLLLFDPNNNLLWSYPPRKPVNLQELRLAILDWVNDNETEFPEIMERLEKLALSP